MAVVGKVGAYAQVQPVQGPDFGGMVKAEFDKIDAEKKAREAAKAKAEKDKQDKVAKLGELGDIKVTNITGFNNGLYNTYSTMMKEYAQAISSGDYFTAKNLKDSLSTLNNATEMANKKMAFNEGEADKLDPDFYNRTNTVLRSINDGNTDIKYAGNGQMLLTVYEDPEKTKVLFENMSPNEIVSSLDSPYKFNLEGSVKEFTKNYRPSSIETLMKDKISTVKKEDVMNDPNVLNGIENKSNELANDSTSLAWYGKTFLNKYQVDVNKFSKEEKEQAKDYFKQRILDSYSDEIDLTIQQKRGSGGSGGGKDGYNVGTPSLYQARSITPEGAPPVTLQGAKTVTIGNSSGKTLTVGGMPMDRVLYDPKSGRLYIGLLYSGSGKEGMGGDGTSAGVGESNKFTKWFTDNSDQFDKFKATYNAAFKKNIQTVEDLKNELFL
jgi:hypothetical protein